MSERFPMVTNEHLQLILPGSMEDRPVVNYERFTIHALESYFRGSIWEQLQKNFLLTNCPRFRNFNSIYSYDLGYSVGEIDIQMHSVHLDFIELVEGEICKQFSDMGINEVRFLQVLEANLNSADETVQRLYSELMKYRSFVEFGKMMNEKFTVLYGGSPDTGTVSSSGSLVLTSSTKVCRVLWDIENIPVNPNIGGLQTVIQLTNYLKLKGVTGEGIDTRISAFLNPFNKSIPKKVIEELNKASVELICASAKREDSDRKLGIRINQEMQLLNPACTTFVIISSDQDFRQHVQLLTNAGYKVIVIHEAKNDNWKNALEMHATAGYDWSAVMNVPKIDVADDRPNALQTIRNKADTVPKHAVGELTNEVPASNSKTRSPQGTAAAGGVVRDPALEAKAVGWRVAVCQRWASAFGFLLVDVSHPEVSSTFTLASPRLLTRADICIDRKGGRSTATAASSAGGVTDTAVSGTSEGATTVSVGGGELVRVYVHNCVLAYKDDTQAQRMLRAGEYVLVRVELDVKGPRAAEVKDLFPRSAVPPNVS